MNSELLMKFCDPSRRNAVVEFPHVYGDKTFATNGYIGVLADGKYTDETCDFNLEGVDFEAEGEFVSIPDVTFDKKCSVCEGTKYTYSRKCSNCNDTGEVSFQDDAFNDYECECKECYGEAGEKKPSNSKAGELCTNCSGTGESRFEFLEFGEPRSEDSKWGISAINISLLKLLPNVKVSEKLTSGKNYAFTFDGGVGIVMPFRIHR